MLHIAGSAAISGWQPLAGCVACCEGWAGFQGTFLVIVDYHRTALRAQRCARSRFARVWADCATPGAPIAALLGIVSRRSTKA